MRTRIRPLTFLALAATLGVACNSEKRATCDASYTRAWGPERSGKSNPERAKWIERCLDMPDDVRKCVEARMEGPLGKAPDIGCEERLKRYEREHSSLFSP